MRSVVRARRVLSSRSRYIEASGPQVLRSSIDKLLMRGIVIVTLQKSLVIRAGSDDRNALHAWSQRQYTIVTQQDSRLGGGLAGQGALLRCLEYRING